jgi:IclR family acetate operon transcriptional repressor
MSIKLVSLVGAVLERFDLRGLAHPILMELKEKTGETVNLGILDGAEAIYLETIPGPGAIRVNTWPGKRLPIHCTALGKALAAELSQDELGAILAKTGLPGSTPNTHTTFESLQADLELTRQRGYAIDDEEDEVGLRCIGAPIRDHQGNTVAALSVTGLAHRVPLANLPELAIAVMDTARRISELQGYRDKARLSKPEVLNASR